MTSAIPQACDILLVEDSSDDVFFLRRAQERSGLELRLCHVENSLRAKDFLLAEGDYADRAGLPLPHLIVSDLKMPQWDGIELLKWVRGDSRFSKLPFILISSSSLERDIDAAYAAGANAYFVKPRTLPGFVHLLTEFQPYWQPRPPNP